MNIEYLKWDSEFFNLKIGKVNINNIFQLKNYRIDMYDLLYVFVEEDKNDLIESFDSNIYLVDKKITFQQNVYDSNLKIINNIKSYKSSEFDEQIVNLGIQSGIYSRFKVDSKFEKGKFEELYSLWIRKSIERNLVDEVLVHQEDKGNITGLITLKRKDDFVEIVILAVDEECRGRNIGKQLIEAAKKYCIEMNVTTLKVNTQMQNYRACNFYSKNGFITEKIQPIYHLWKN